MSLERTHTCVKDGPLASALGQWLKEGRRVRVVTRHARGIRSATTGQLVAFDRLVWGRWTSTRAVSAGCGSGGCCLLMTGGCGPGGEHGVRGTTAGCDHAIGAT